MESGFSELPDDVVLSILSKLEDDPRNWPRVACVSTKFSSLIRTVCFKTKCWQSIPAVVSDLLPPGASAPPGVWASLYKLAVCCPGLLHSGVLLDNSDFGLHREIGPDESFFRPNGSRKVSSSSSTCKIHGGEIDASASDLPWSSHDDLPLDALYAESETSLPETKPEVREIETPEFTACKRRKTCRLIRSHMASGVWKLSREQGNKLLASRFKGDCLYICDWPGCIHREEKRNYMLFRGIFKNFKQSRVWRTINDGIKSKTGLQCAFCSSTQTWDLHSSFCLRRYYGYHDDGEPVVRAYVCENGHVSGAWTDWPLYT